MFHLSSPVSKQNVRLQIPLGHFLWLVLLSWCQYLKTSMQNGEFHLFFCPDFFRRNDSSKNDLLYLRNTMTNTFSFISHLQVCTSLENLGVLRRYGAHILKGTSSLRAKKNLTFFECDARNGWGARN